MIFEDFEKPDLYFNSKQKPFFSLSQGRNEILMIQIVFLSLCLRRFLLHTPVVFEENFC